MSWWMSAWMTASISISRARRPATLIMVWYSPWNQPAVRSGLVVVLTRSPTLPVTQTAAFVTQVVTPRMTKSPAAPAALLTALETASQTLPTTGSWQGSARIGSARAGAVNGPASAARQRRSANAAVSRRSDGAWLGLDTGELLEAGDAREQLARGFGLRVVRERRGGAGRALEARDLPGAVLPDE